MYIQTFTFTWTSYFFTHSHFLSVAISTEAPAASSASGCSVAVMAPKKVVGRGRPAGRGAGGRGAAQAPDAVVVAEPSVQISGLNSDLWMKHSDNMQKVFSHPVFEQSAVMDPIDLNNNEGEASGNQAVFVQSVAVTSLKKTGSFKCAINLAWLDLHFISNPHIPLVWASVETMQNRYFKKPGGFADIAIEVGILEAVVDNGDYGLKGTWKRTSPDEVVMAWFKAVAERVGGGAEDDEMNEWLHHMLTTPCTFVKLADETELGWRASKLRENIAANTTLARTAVQKVLDVAQRRAQLGNVSAQRMLDIYTEKLGDGGGGEPITLSFIDKAFNIWDKALRKPEIQEVVLREESRREMSMFNSVVGMNTLVTKAKTEDNIEYIFAAIQDGRRAGLLGPEHMVTRSLEGKIPGSNGKGLVDLLIFKKNMLAHLLTVVVPSKSIPAGMKAKIQDVCSTFAKFRAHLGYKNDSGAQESMPDQGWRAGWPASADALLGLIEDIPLM